MSKTKRVLSEAVYAARHLLGYKISHRSPAGLISGMIVETEAYSAFDASSHSYRGQTPRNSVMFGANGHAYIYFTYGLHYCFNIVTGPVGSGEAVLIRAVEPIEGTKLMAQNRGGKQETELTNGPAKFCQAFGINKNLNGHDLSQKPLWLEPLKQFGDSQIAITTRIGISSDTDRPWRFYIKDNPFVSKV